MKRLTLLPLLVLAACASCPPAQTKIIDKGCEWAQPFAADPADTLETRQHVLAWGKTWLEHCRALAPRT